MRYLEKVTLRSLFSPFGIYLSALFVVVALLFTRNILLINSLLIFSTCKLNIILIQYVYLCENLIIDFRKLENFQILLELLQI